MLHDPIIIVGTGLAGYGLAKEIRKYDKHIPLVLLTTDDGSYYSKPQLSTALSKNKAPHELVISDYKAMSVKLNAKILTHCKVSSIDRDARMVIANGNNYPYHSLILACGASPLGIQFPGGADESIVRVNNLMQYASFREKLRPSQHVAIIGSGLIGCEFANDLIVSGYKVSVISLDRYPLQTLSPTQASKSLQTLLSQSGVKWHMQRSVEAVKNTAEGFDILLDDGTSVVADNVLCAIGLRANVSLAKDADITVNHGIVADAYLQTNDKHIYTIGDCAEIEGETRQFVLPINHSIKALAQTLLGNPTPVNFPTMPIMIKTSCCPIVTCPPIAPNDTWEVIMERAHHIKALALDKEKRLLGFTLVGDQVAQKNTLIEAMMQANSIENI